MYDFSPVRPLEKRKTRSTHAFTQTRSPILVRTAIRHFLSNKYSVLGLNFVLEVGWKIETGPPGNQDMSMSSVLMAMHKPIGVECETDEFRERLGYYGEDISFHFDQVDVYMKEIEQRLGPDWSPDDETR